MHSKRFSALFPQHLPIVRHMVFCTGNRTGIAIQADRRTGQKKRIHYIPDRFRITGFNRFRFLEDILNVGCYEIINFLTVMIAVDHHSKMPVVKSIQLPDQIGKAGNRHTIGGRFENIRVSDDHFRAVGRHCRFQIIDIHNPDRSRKAIHRRPGCYRKAWQAEFKTRKPQHVRDRACTDTDHQVTVIRFIEHYFAESGFIKA